MKNIFSKILNIGAPKGIAASFPDQDFLPYVAHYNSETIINKNGELIQTIRVVGLPKDASFENFANLRNVLRKSITNNLDKISKKTEKENIAFWFHTIRRSKNLRSNPEEVKNYFARYVDDRWNEESLWEKQFVNEFYITIVIGGLDYSIRNLKAFLGSFSKSSVFKVHQSHLDKSLKILTELTDSVLEDVKVFGAKKLCIYEWEGVLYSEQMRFFSKIVNLSEDHYPVGFKDMSYDLVRSKIAFGDREIEVHSLEDKNFAAILSIKEYQETKIANIDNLMRLPIQFIITQFFDLNINQKELEQYEYQDYILKISGDEEFREISGIKEFFTGLEEGDKPRYSSSQTTIMVISNEFEKLKTDIIKINDTLSVIGQLAIREELFLEHCFWSQLPGNFYTVVRKKNINIKNIAGFACLNSFPSGSFAGNTWGSPLTIMRTIIDTPYFFNFHHLNNGNNLIVADINNKQNYLINFLITQSSRFNPRIFYFTNSNSSLPITKAIDGNFYNVQNLIKEKSIELFNYNNAKTHNLILTELLISFIYSLIPEQQSQSLLSELKFAEVIIEDSAIFKKINSFTDLVELFNRSETRNLHQALTHNWIKGNFTNIFNTTNNLEKDKSNQIDWQKRFLTFNFEETYSKKDLTVPILINLMSSVIEISFNDNEPKIIVLDSVTDLFIDKSSLKLLSLITKIAKDANVAILASYYDRNDLQKFVDIKHVFGSFANEIYATNSYIIPNYKSVFRLSDEEFSALQQMEDDNYFLLKYGQTSLMASAMINDNQDLAEFIEGSPTAVMIVEEILEDIARTKGKEPFSSEDWFGDAINILGEIHLEEHRSMVEEDRKRKVAAKQRLQQFDTGM